MLDAAGPSHDLLRIQQLCRWNKVVVSYRALSDGRLLGFDPEGIIDCVLVILPCHFDRTYPSTSPGKEGRMQDVYKLRCEEKRLYVKLDLFEDTAYVVTFHEDESK